MKPVLQSEATECGLACLCMVLNHHGCEFDLNYLRDKFAASQRGQSLRSILRLADRFGLSGRPLRFELEYLSRLDLPCILHWGLMHYVVLVKVYKNEALIYDPAIGARRVSFAELNESATGVAVEFQATSQFKAQTGKRSLTFRQFVRESLSVKGVLVWLIVASLAFETLTLLLPFHLQLVLDVAVPSRSTEVLWYLVAVFLSVSVCLAVAEYARAKLSVKASQSLTFEWQDFLFGHILSLPLSFFAKRNLGDINSRMRGLEQVQRALSVDLIEAMLGAAFLVLIVIVLFLYDVVLAAISISSLLIVLLMRSMFMSKLFSQTQAYEIYAAKQDNMFFETISSVAAVKVYGGYADRRSLWLNRVVRTQSANVELETVKARLRVLSRLTFLIERVGVVTYGALLVLNGALTTGMLVAFLLYREIFSSKALRLVELTTEIKQIDVYLDRLSDIVYAQPEPKGSHEMLVSEDGVSVEFRNVWFRYSSDEPWILKGCSFAVEPGETVVIKGESGCGKTTLISLAQGLLEPSEGEVLVGGVQVHAIERESKSRIMASVQQNDVLLDGSIADNIAIFDPQPDLDRVFDAGRRAQLSDDVQLMPMGWHTPVSSLGSGLSGGQIQRILFARALYAAPKLAFFDEVTSHLDQDNAKRIASEIEALNGTVICISHSDLLVHSARQLNFVDGRLLD